MGQTGFALPKDLKRRILFTLGILAICRIGVFITVPGVDASGVREFFGSQGGILNLLNTFTGGALQQASVFALGIMPYITASIIFQLLQTSIPALERLKKEGEPGRRKINQYTRYATVAIALFQSFGIATFLSSGGAANTGALMTVPFFGFIPFKLMVILSLTAGSCFIMWLGEQITAHGVGNGASLIIFAGIIAGLPGGTVQLYQAVQSGQMSGAIALGIILGMVAVIGFIVFMEVAQRRISIQHSQRGMGRDAMNQQGSHLPLKVNFAGVIPPIFASSLLIFPSSLTQMVNVPWLQGLQEWLSPSGSLWNLLFMALIIFFTFFYTDIAFNADEVAENLKKSGGFIPGVRAGNSTATYIRRVLDRITVTGAIYLAAVCVMPTLLSKYMGIPFYFGGANLLILVGVALDTSQQIQSHLLTARYDGLMKGIKVKSRRVRY